MAHRVVSAYKPCSSVELEPNPTNVDHCWHDRTQQSQYNLQREVHRGHWVTTCFPSYWHRRRQPWSTSSQTVVRRRCQARELQLSFALWGREESLSDAVSRQTDPNKQRRRDRFIITAAVNTQNVLDSYCIQRSVWQSDRSRAFLCRSFTSTEQNIPCAFSQ